MLKLDCCFITDVGKIRTNNEDNFFICGPYKRTPEELRYRKKDFVYRGGIFAVCDGMGGEEFGEKASLISVEELNNFKEKDFNEYHKKYIDMVNSRICDLRFENNGVKSGTTIALIYIKDEKAISYNIGDSRTYLMRNKKLTQLSEDHTQVAQMLKMGMIKEENVQSYSNRHILTQHLGIPNNELVISPYISDVIDIKRGDIFLLCSDGLTDMIRNDDIKNILNSKMSAEQMAETLVNSALQMGGKDNITVGVIKNAEPKETVWKKVKKHFV